MSGFRKLHSFQSVLLMLIDTCRTALDRKEKCTLLLTDLSKAFDCVPHRLMFVGKTICLWSQCQCMFPATLRVGSNE